MKTYSLVPPNHLALRAPCEPAILSRCYDLIEAMASIMRKHNGIGLAAPQVGVSLKVFVLNAAYLYEEGYTFGSLPIEDGYIALLNPTVAGKGNVRRKEEMCLSLPRIKVMVPRYTKCDYKCLGMDGNWHSGVATGLQARVMQHEDDHLNSKLIVDY